jgi:hypothetical protein
LAAGHVATWAGGEAEGKSKSQHLGRRRALPPATTMCLSKEFFADMRRRYTAQKEKMEGLTGRERLAIVKDILASNDVVFAAWLDPDYRRGVAMLGIKGSVLLGEVSASDKSERLTLGVVPCLGVEHAIQVGRVGRMWENELRLRKPL